MKLLLDIVNGNVLKKRAKFDIKLKNVGQTTLLQQTSAKNVPGVTFH